MAALSDLDPSRILSWSPVRFLQVNAVVAAFVLVAHGGALVAGAEHGHPNFDAIRRDTLISLPLAGLVLVSAVLAWLRPRLRPAVLRAHAVALLLLSIYLAAWAIELLFARRVPENTLWIVGYLTAIVVYSVALFVKHGLAGPVPTAGFRPSAPLLALAAAGILDIGVLIKSLA